MNISEAQRCPCGPWHETPAWQRWLGKPPYRRALYAWPQIGGGWDGWEYAASNHPTGMTRQTEGDLSPRQRALAGELVKEGHAMQDAIDMAALTPQERL